MNLYTVIKGEGIGGKKLVPTINLRPAELPAKFDFGVYTCTVLFESNQKKVKGVLFYGPKQSFNQKKTVLEIHLLDFKEDVYGEKVVLEMGTFLREIKKLNSLEELKKQIEADISLARQS